MKFVAKKTDSGIELFVNNKKINSKRSATLLGLEEVEFGWGASPGSAVLALAILLEAFEDEFALNNYQKLEDEVISKIPDNALQWKLTASRIDLLRGLRKLGGLKNIANKSKKEPAILGK